MTESVWVPSTLLKIPFRFRGVREPGNPEKVPSGCCPRLFLKSGPRRPTEPVPLLRLRAPKGLESVHSLGLGRGRVKSVRQSGWTQETQGGDPSIPFTRIVYRVSYRTHEGHTHLLLCSTSEALVVSEDGLFCLFHSKRTSPSVWRVNSKRRVESRKSPVTSLCLEPPSQYLSSTERSPCSS